MSFFKNYSLCHEKFEKIKADESSARRLCQELLNQIMPEANNKTILYGNSKIYLKMEVESQLDVLKFEIIKKKMKRGAIILIALYRGHKVRVWYKRKRAGATNIANFIKKM